jgi:hypothetical protein
MADLIIKPATGDGNQLILKDKSGDAVLTTLNNGALFQNKDTISDNITIAAGYSAFLGSVNFTGTVTVNGNLSIV